eukprot:CAMPEP_0180234578 /NCGR_PEP_ID=MMETSP0987-20121128/28739_1 /TAXON_ID=697907 /ORGANISM="non described non described, Strain CCMP2293" /LENGTH=139 /DNA_ID=CAMNT_0022200583 /DNA_START=1 /DNA_END=420 /DNA_ORIENTATION=+
MALRLSFALTSLTRVATHRSATVFVSRPAVFFPAQAAPAALVGRAFHSSPPSCAKAAKAKDPTDENKVKRPLTSYFLFCAEQRALLAEQRALLTPFNPKELAPLSGKELGIMWKELTEEEQQRYKDQYAVNKAKYDANK